MDESSRSVAGARKGVGAKKREERDRDCAANIDSEKMKND